jgi:hypothetical protein
MKPLYIKHRVNSISDLGSVESDWGVEIDLRSKSDTRGQIILSHDPWKSGDSLEDWLKTFKSRGITGPIILNTKEDGLETRAQELLAIHGIQNYFFLDTTFPTLVKRTRELQETCYALRVSSFEPVEAAIAFEGRAKWIWVDCFGGIPLEPRDLERIRSKFKICLVSPELHGASTRIEDFRDLYPYADAICSKTPGEWRKAFE